MKTIPAALQAHYGTGATCMAQALLIERADGQLFGFTSHDKPFTLDTTPWGHASSALQFDHRQGLSGSAIVTTSGFNVDNMELTTLDDGTFFNRDDILAGKWRNAAFRIFRYRWDVATPTIANDIETLFRGWFGEITIGATTIKVELRGLAQKLQQPVGIVSTKTCRARLGDAACTVALGPLTTTLTVTGVTDKRTFAASAASTTNDFYGEGIVTWLTGANAGVSQKVRTYAWPGNTFTLVLPMVLDIAVGDTFSAVAGCRKRLDQDCKLKFNNVLNFQGEPHRPMLDDLVKPVTPNA